MYKNPNNEDSLKLPTYSFIYIKKKSSEKGNRKKEGRKKEKKKWNVWQNLFPKQEIFIYQQSIIGNHRSKSNVQCLPEIEILKTVFWPYMTTKAAAIIKILQRLSAQKFGKWTNMEAMSTKAIFSKLLLPGIYAKTYNKKRKMRQLCDSFSGNVT